MSPCPLPVKPLHSDEYLAVAFLPTRGPLVYEKRMQRSSSGISPGAAV